MKKKCEVILFDICYRGVEEQQRHSVRGGQCVPSPTNVIHPVNQVGRWQVGVTPSKPGVLSPGRAGCVVVGGGQEWWPGRSSHWSHLGQEHSERAPRMWPSLYAYFPTILGEGGVSRGQKGNSGDTGQEQAGVGAQIIVTLLIGTLLKLSAKIH